MVRGMNSYEDKQRRKMRRQNHIAKDLRQDPKYKMRVVKPAKNRDGKYPLNPFNYSDENDND